MQATITYLLTEQAQRAQMAATGSPVARKQTVTVEVAAEDLDCYPIQADGSIAVDLITRRNEIPLPAEYDARPDIPAMIRAWRQKQADLCRLLAEADHGMATYLDAESPNIAHGHREYVSIWRHALEQISAVLKPLPAGIDPRYNDYQWADIRRMAPLTARAVEAWATRQTAAITADNARLAQQRADREAAAAAKEAEKETFRAAWIAEHGDGALQSQFAEGLLCRETLTTMIAERAFAVAKIPLEYQYRRCDDSGCPCGERAVSCLPTPVYDRWLTVKTGLPDGATAKFCTVRRCERDMDNDGEIYGEYVASEPVYCATIELTCGPFKFERLIKIDE